MVYLVYTGHSSPNIERVLTPNETTVARSYWPLKDKRKLNSYQQQALDLAWSKKFSMIQGPPGMYIFHKLWQIEINLFELTLPSYHWYTACHSCFGHISAGTGKSVTGAHIAYALAMRLCKEVSPDKNETTACCVMYCGPSQQSVNVVLGKSAILLSKC